MSIKDARVWLRRISRQPQFIPAVIAVLYGVLLSAIGAIQTVEWLSDRMDFLIDFLTGRWGPLTITAIGLFSIAWACYTTHPATIAERTRRRREAFFSAMRDDWHSNPDNLNSSHHPDYHYPQEDRCGRCGNAYPSIEQAWRAREAANK